ncbi:pyridoxal phosphate-dependent decarboxylase family protein [Nonomuraea sp. NPDC050536]|uniref:pyridoxal phosphate-dependent decarboxylase family protein n=1 Tax=Nonomuraea sp. NPDC050536 TaxID=3364366 RepID=UPI0037CC3C9B
MTSVDHDSRAAVMDLLRGVVDDYLDWREACGSTAGPPPDSARHLVRELSGRLARESTPWPSPLYLAHMTADTPVAVTLAYLCALLYNPNNVSSEASPVTTQLEHDVGDDLCRLVGYHPARGWAHLASGAHAANYEALWIARNLRRLPRAAAEDPPSRDLVADIPDIRLANLPVGRVLDLVDELARRGTLERVRRLAQRGRSSGKLLFARNAHYAWHKCADLLGFGSEDVESVELDRHHRIDLSALRRRVVELIERGRPIVAVVATLGSTGEGSVDDLDGIMRLRDWCEQRHGASFSVHVDAAFGGFHRAICLDRDGAMLPHDDPALSVRLKPHVYAAFRALARADSVTVDPHKCGYAPYPAGGLALRDRRAAAVVASRSVYFADGDRQPYAPYTLEGARPGAAAAAVWAAHRLIGLHAGGYGRLLGGCMASAQRLHQRFSSTGQGLVSCYEPDLNIVNIAARDEIDPLLDRLRADAAAAPMTSLWVSSNALADEGERVLRLCVMKELHPRDLDQVCRKLRDARASSAVALRDPQAAYTAGRASRTP